MTTTPKLPSTITLTGVTRRYADWNGDLAQWLQVGDYVDEDLRAYFLEVLPPAYFSSGLIQMGESADSFGDDGKPRWLSIQKHHSGRWAYIGPRMYRDSVILTETIRKV